MVNEDSVKILYIHYIHNICWLCKVHQCRDHSLLVVTVNINIFPKTILPVMCKAHNGGVGDNGNERNKNVLRQCVAILWREQEYRTKRSNRSRNFFINGHDQWLQGVVVSVPHESIQCDLYAMINVNKTFSTESPCLVVLVRDRDAKRQSAFCTAVWAKIGLKFLR